MIDISSFNERGQRIEYGEVLSDENEPKLPEATNSIIYDSIVNFLSVSQNNIVEIDEDLINIRHVLNTLVNIMGVNIDITKIDKKCVSLYRDNYKTLSSFKKKQAKSDKKKPVEKQHQDYNRKTLIYVTSCYLLIYSQITLKNLMVSPFSKCIPKLSGYPLEEEDKDGLGNFGINYITCILSNLKESKGIWNVLEKKDTIKINFINTIKKLLNSSLKLRLEQRNIDIENERVLLDEQKEVYSWNDFRPPLRRMGNNNSVIDLGDTDFSSKKSLKKSMKIFKNKKDMCSLYIIDKINSIIDSQPLENILYEPLPIGNSCCMEDIDMDYNYFTFLHKNDKEKNLISLINNSRDMTKFNTDANDLKFYIKPEESIAKLESYAKNIYLGEEDIDKILSTGDEKDKQILANLFNNYLESGGVGKKYYERYSFLTYAENKGINEIPIGSKADILLLLAQMKDTNMVTIENNKSIQISSNQKKCLDKLANILDNEFLLENDFNRDLLSQIRNIENTNDKEINNLWRLLDNTVKRYKTTLFEKITKNVSNKNVKTIKDTLDNLLNFEKIEKEEEDTIEENVIVLNKKIHLQKLNYKRKEDTIKKYIFNYLVKYCKLLSNINNKSKTVVDKNERLEEKKLLGIEYNFLIIFFKESNVKYFKLIIKMLNNINQLRNINGYADIYGCEIKIESSVFDFEKSSKLLELNFYFILTYIIELIDNYEESIKSLSGKNSDVTPIGEEDDEDNATGVDKKGSIIRHFVIDLLKKIKNDTDFYNSHTQNTVFKDIKTKNEESKDRNLHVMERLDREEINLRNLQTEAGLTKYENLFTDYEQVLKEAEINDNLIKKYEQVYGDIPGTDDSKFLDFKMDEEKRMREEKAIGNDNLDFAISEGYLVSEEDNEDLIDM